MTLKITIGRKAPARSGLHAIGVTTERLEDSGLGLDLAVLTSLGFEAKPGQIEIVSGPDGPTAVVGLGDAAAVDTGKLRGAAVAIARAARHQRTIAVSLLDSVPEQMAMAAAAQAVAEGLVSGHYEYLALKSDADASKLRSITVVGSGRGVAAALARGQAIADGVNTARDLVNEPGGSMTPTAFARRAGSIARATSLRADIMDLAAIRKARLGGILGVNRGSEQQPRFVRLTYTPSGRSRGHVALVGKGVTFDSGGLSIKSGAGMMTMKCDMAGAAVVLGAMSAIAAVGPDVKVSAFMPLTDNMTGGDATRPGDVLKIRNGKTVEVLNTDAEGRLILADALSLASEAKPDAIIDLATLTGAAVAALGPQYAAVMGTNASWVDQVLAAGGRADERLWELPLPESYRPMLDSTIADLKNIGGPLAGALTAGLFLSEFVTEGLPWAHVDIAGPSFIDTPFDEHPVGGTGFAVRTLVELVDGFSMPEPALTGA